MGKEVNEFVENFEQNSLADLDGQEMPMNNVAEELSDKKSLELKKTIEDVEKILLET